MGAYLMGDKLEFAKRQYSVHEVFTESTILFDNPKVPTLTETILFTQSQTVALRMPVDKVYVCSELKYSSVEEIKSVDMSKVHFYCLGAIVYSQKVASGGSSRDFVSNSETPGILQVSESYDADNFYVSVTVNTNMSFIHNNEECRAIEIEELFGYFTYDNKYLVYNGGTYGTTPVCYFNNDIFTKDKTLLDVQGVEINMPTEHTDETEKQRDKILDKGDDLYYKSGVPKYKIQYSFATNLTTTNSLKNKSADGLILTLNVKVSQREIAKIV